MKIAPVFCLFFMSLEFATEMEINRDSKDIHIEMRELKKENSSVQKPSDGSRNCCICYETLLYDARLVKTPCVHPPSFHLDCLTTWLTNQSSNCPLCRHKIKLEELQKYDPKRQEYKNVSRQELQNMSLRCGVVRTIIVKIAANPRSIFVTVAELVYSLVAFLIDSLVYGTKNWDLVNTFTLYMFGVFLSVLTFMFARNPTRREVQKLFFHALVHVFAVAVVIYTIARQIHRYIQYNEHYE
jgi:hypothetical protein